MTVLVHFEIHLLIRALVPSVEVRFGLVRQYSHFVLLSMCTILYQFAV